MTWWDRVRATSVLDPVWRSCFLHFNLLPFAATAQHSESAITAGLRWVIRITLRLAGQELFAQRVQNLSPVAHLGGEIDAVGTGNYNGLIHQSTKARITRTDLTKQHAGKRPIVSDRVERH